MRSLTAQKHESQISNFYFLISSFRERLQNNLFQAKLDQIKCRTMNERVLLLDDEKDFVEAMAERMRARGMEVTAITSPSEALKRAREESYDVIVMDFMMPEIDGLEALKELKRINPDLQIILLTGYATMEKKIEAKNLGATDLVEKPADIDTLTDKIRKTHEKNNTLLN